MVLTCPHCLRICLLPEFFEEHKLAHEWHMTKQSDEHANKTLPPDNTSKRKTVDTSNIAKFSKGLPSTTTKGALSQDIPPSSVQPKVASVSPSSSSATQSIILPAVSEALASRGKHLDSETQEISCNICHENFNTQSQHIQHLFSHSQVDKCARCHVSFINLGEYEIDQLLHSLPLQETFHKCRRCQAVFLGKSNLLRHVNYAHEHEFDLQCHKCNNSFLNIYLYQHHLVKHINRSLQICTKYCGMVFDEEESLKEHIYFHRGRNSNDMSKVRNYQCHYCALNFCSAIKLYYHRYILHNKQRPYNCEKCHRIFFDLAEYFSHKCGKKHV